MCCRTLTERCRRPSKNSLVLYSEYFVRCPRGDITSDPRRRTVTRKADPNEKWLLVQSALEDFSSSFVSAFFDRLSAAASLAKMLAFSSQTSQLWPSIRARCRQNASNDR